MRGVDHVLTYLPMFHVGGLLIHTLPAFHIGARVSLVEEFDPGRRCADKHSLRDELETLHAMAEGLCALFEQHIVRVMPENPLPHHLPALDYLQGLKNELDAGLS